MFDRVLATRFGAKATELAHRGERGVMVAIRCQDIVKVPIADAIADLKKVPEDHHLLKCAVSIGTSFGV
jgi:6-phosphofructokinase 1